MSARTPRIIIIAGEASGDLQGACLAAEIRRAAPQAVIRGVGGRRMREAEVELLFDSSAWGAIGTTEALKLVPRLSIVLSKLKARLNAVPPDVLVLIDFGAFNVRLGKHAHARGVKVLYYFPPGSWNRNSGGSRLKEVTDRVVTPFPWSAELLNRAGIRADFFGHPLLDVVRPTLSKPEFCERFDLDPERPIIGLLPGSRKQEIVHNLPAQADAARKLSESIPGLQFAIPLASSLDPKGVRKIAGEEIKILPGMAYDLLAHSRAAIVKSGTATVEAMILGCPMVIVYRGSLLTTLEFKLRRKRIKFIGMPNIIMDREICPELTAKDASPERIAGLMIELIPPTPERAQMLKNLADAKAVLGDPGAIEKTARTVLEMANDR
ncbi:MAG TPA: lipid-A-disaccharide synthase [Armatimonadota bacterium]|nr:lipid-A-disaccharide synthase [Armatimonadota bacterium]